MHTWNNLRWAAVVVVFSVVVAAGCATSDQAAERGDEHVHYRPAMVNVADVMQVKLIHTQAIVEGLALGDMRQVAMNAESLHGLSTRASWMVHDTVTYVALSETFRERVMALQALAEAGDVDGAMDSYLEVTRSCLDCHTYLREERQFKDAPGRRSMLPQHRDVSW